MTQDTQTYTDASLRWPWLKSMSRELYELDETPLLGAPPAFPWEVFAENFSSTFGIEGCTFSPQELSWQEEQTLVKGMPEPRFWTEIGATPLEGSFFILTSKQDVLALMQKTLEATNGLSKTEIPDEMLDAFHRFLMVQAAHLVNSSGYDARLSFRILSQNKCQENQTLCQDITASIGNMQFSFRLIIPKAFQTSFKSFYVAREKKEIPNKERLEQVQTTLHIEAARTSLSMHTLLQLNPGDFLCIDHPFYIPNSEQNHLLLSLDNRPLYRAEYANNQITISEITLDHEVYDSMVDNINQSSTRAGRNNNASQASEKPVVSKNLEREENPFEDEDELEEMDFNVDQSELEQAAERVLPSTKKAPSIQPKQKPVMGKANELTAADISLSLAIEVGQIQITAKKLLELQPGNVLDLDLAVDSGVDLVVNGRTIGKGELLQIGETLGVRILQIGA